MKIEDSIIISLLKLTDNKENLKKIFTDSAVDLLYIINTGKKHLVQTQILDALGKIIPPSYTKESIIDYIKQSIINNTVTNIHIQKEISYIISLLNNNDVETIIVKGPTLDDSGLREMGDIDILIRQKDLIKAKKTLEKDSYRYTGNIENNLLSKNERNNMLLQMSWNCQYQFRHKKTNLLLELHTNIFDKARSYDINLDHLLNNIDSFWERKTWSEKLHCFTLKKEDTLILMCMHNAIKRSPANNRFTLRNLVDIDHLISSGVDWEDFYSRTKELNISPFILFSLQMTKKYFGSKLPQNIIIDIELLCTPWETRMVRIHHRCIISLNKISIFYSNIFKILVPFVFHSSWKLRIKRVLLLNILFPPRWRMSAIYNISINNPLIVLTYLINPLRWIYLLVKNIFI